MRRNPLDWSIENVVTVCRQIGFDCTPPSGGGSHYKLSHPDLEDILTVPAKRPIKPVYIRKLVALADAVAAKRERGPNKEKRR